MKQLVSLNNNLNDKALYHESTCNNPNSLTLACRKRYAKGHSALILHAMNTSIALPLPNVNLSSMFIFDTSVTLVYTTFHHKAD